MRLLLLLALSGLSASTLASSVLSEPRYPPGHILYHATKPANKKAPTLPSEAPHMYTGGDILDHINDIKKSVNTACPVDQDAVREMEKIFFDYTIEEFETARDIALKRQSPCFNWHSDGCTMSPDKPFGCNFKPSCHRHNFAWHNFRQRQVYTKSMKRRVEQQFADDLEDVCKPKAWLRKLACRTTAKLYVSTVRVYPANKPTDPGA